jgi:hypothetical protein
MLVSSMCNAASVEIWGYKFEKKPPCTYRKVSTKSYSPLSRREGVPRSAAPRMGRFSASSSEGLGNNSEVKRLGLSGSFGRK